MTGITKLASGADRAIGTLLIVEALAFGFFAFLHLGTDVPRVVFDLHEPVRPYAVIVESVAAIALSVAAFVVLNRRSRAWRAGIGAQALALVGVAWGVIAINAGRGPHTELNDGFHRVMILVLIAGVAVLTAPRVRGTMERPG